MFIAKEAKVSVTPGWTLGEKDRYSAGECRPTDNTWWTPAFSAGQPARQVPITGVAGLKGIDGLH